jgi:hypothetical protein
VFCSLEPLTPVFSIRIPQFVEALVSNPQSKIRIPKSFDQPPLHFCDGQGEKDEAEKQQEEKGPQQVDIDQSETEGPG